MLFSFRYIARTVLEHFLLKSDPGSYSSFVPEYGLPYWSLESQQVFYSKIAHILIIVICLFVSPDGFSCSYLNSNIYASFDVAKQVWKSFITVVARKINSGAEHRCQLRPVTCFKKSVINFLTWRTIQYFFDVAYNTNFHAYLDLSIFVVSDDQQSRWS